MQQLKDDMRDVKIALLGTMKPGDPPGALAVIEKLTTTVYSPSDASQSHDARIRRLEDGRNQLIGWCLCGAFAVSTFIGLLTVLVEAWKK